MQPDTSTAALPKTLSRQVLPKTLGQTSFAPHYSRGVGQRSKKLKSYVTFLTNNNKAFGKREGSTFD